MPPDHAGDTGAPGKRETNRLSREKSPYLLQHAENPVNWYPWGEEAFLRAEREDKPVFLSIGYATCHWCHVMAHESFEDREVADLLNRNFVCIKVDREERPDIDAVYMAACQLMTGQGGWPLTIVMTPDKKPFFAATYLSPRGRVGMTGLVDLLPRISALWNERRDALLSSAEEIVGLLDAPAGVSARKEPAPGLISAGYEALSAAYDPAEGGFGRAPKFPSPPILLFLLRYYCRTGEEAALRMAKATLRAMQNGGIYDHLGGGFHRYSVDAKWQVPHFEKMLYDQALLAVAYTEAASLIGDKTFWKTAEDTLAYLVRELGDKEGAFISAEDADSPGGEGAFYLWSRKEIFSVLGNDDARFAFSAFDLVPAGGEKGGVLVRRPGPDTRSPDEEERIAAICTRLHSARLLRERPARDTKILADTSSLAITALVAAYRASDNREYLSTAIRAMQFILGSMKMPDGGLFHRYREGEAAIPGFADDYAFAVRALLDLFLATYDPVWLEEAVRLEGYFTENFRDESAGGYFQTAARAERLFVRKKEFADSVIPSANAVALGNLVHLWHLTGNPRYDGLALELARAGSGTAARYPASCSGFLSSLDLLANPVTLVALTGTDTDGGIPRIAEELRGLYLPSAIVVWCGDPLPERNRRLRELMPWTADLAPAGEEPRAYICTGHRCSLPVAGREQILALLPKIPEPRHARTS